MKQLITPFFSLLILSLLGSGRSDAQSLEIQDAPAQPITAQPSAVDVQSKMYVKNTSSSAKQVRGFRRMIDEVQGSQNRFCWGPNCWLPSDDTSGAAPSISGNGGVDSTFIGYYNANGNPGVTTIEYCFYVESDPSDSACTIVRYDATSSVSIQERDLNNAEFSFSPNPARHELRVKLKASSKGVIRIRSILGKTVLEKNVQENGRALELDVSQLDEGLHFLTFEAQDGSTLTKKLMIGSK